MRPGSVLVSALTHAALLVAAVIVPLLATSDLPEVRNALPSAVRVYHAGIIPSIPQPPRTGEAVKRPGRFAAPLVAPRGITPEKPLPPIAGVPTATGGIEIEASAGLPAGLGDDQFAGFGPPPPPPPPPPPVKEPVRPGGKIRAPARIAYVAPVYPPIAQAARVEGIVVVEATIDVDGRVRDVRVLRSYPLLDQAAIDAVKQWRYSPTLLNGLPVPVLMTVAVNFRLQE